jgi:hypothetical protein
MAFIILFAIGCKKENEPANTLNISTEDSIKAAQEIDSVINGYTQAHNEMNAQKAADYFINSPEMLVLENGERYADWATLAKFIKDFYSTTASAKVTWTEQKVLVLSNTAGVMTGKFTFESISKDKKKYASSGWATILLIKQNNQWKFQQYHESYKILTK